MKIPPPATDNLLNISVLNAQSQSGRLKVANLTKGVKADRLQFVAELGPVAEIDAADHNWSATSVVVNDGRAYVTWHSNHQAATQADKWGGAIDVIDIPADGSNAPWALQLTAQNNSIKLNQGYIANGRLYLAGTGSTTGATVGSIALPITETSTLRYINLPGSSANGVELIGSNLIAATGYDGGAYSFDANFDTAESIGKVQVNNIATPNVTFDSWLGESVNNNSYGGKYVTGGYVLRTDDNVGAIVPVNNPSQPIALDVPLTSTEKFAEAYDPEAGEWYPLDGDKAAHYGKHTMAIDGDFAYVGAGQNGLHVYNVSTGASVWSNNNSTTAVVSQVDYIYAATGIGLRVYKKNADGTLALYAYEVDEYNADGTANSSTAASNGHSANFVAVGGGYIFVAYGQTGVRIYRLDENAPEQPETLDTTLEVPFLDNYKDTKKIKPDENGEFTVPEGPTENIPEGKEFAGWSTTENGTEAEHQPGDKVEIPAGDTKILYPVWKDKAVEYTYTITFDLESTEGNEVTGDKPADMTWKGTAESHDFTVPGQGNIAKEGFDFKGWSTEKGNDQGLQTTVYAPNTDNAKITLTKDNLNVTLYPVWSIKQGGTGAGGSGGDDLGQ